VNDADVSLEGGIGGTRGSFIGQQQREIKVGTTSGNSNARSSSSSLLKEHGIGNS